MSDQDTTQISRYLLGQLPQEDMDRIECRLMSETGLFELAETVEDDVIDRYVRGELSPEERRRFERRLLPSPRIRERVELARTLAAHTARRGTASGRPGREAIVIPFFRPAGARLAWAASLVALLLAGWLSFQLVGLRGQAGEIEEGRLAAVERAEELRAQAEQAKAVARLAEAEEARAEDLEGELVAARETIAELRSREAPAEPIPGAGQAERRVRRPGEYGEGAATLSVLLSLATRSGAEPTTVELDGSERLELQMELPGPRPADAVTATVTREGVVVWRETEIEVESLEGESMARLVLPEELLLPGPYRIELTAGADPGRPLSSYEMLVEN